MWMWDKTTKIHHTLPLLPNYPSSPPPPVQSRWWMWGNGAPRLHLLWWGGGGVNGWMDGSFGEMLIHLPYLTSPVKSLQPASLMKIKQRPPSTWWQWCHREKMKHGCDKKVNGCRLIKAGKYDLSSRRLLGVLLLRSLVVATCSQSWISSFCGAPGA